MMFITIMLLVLGLIFWMANLFGSVPQFTRCMPPEEYWLQSNPPLFVVFVFTFLSLLLWSFFEFGVLVWSNQVSRVNLIMFCANTLTLVVIGYALQRLNVYIHDYGAILEYENAEWNTTESSFYRRYDCGIAKSYVGRWKVLLLSPERNHTLHTIKEIEFNRDFSFKAYHSDSREPHHGRWEIPINRKPNVGRPVEPIYWDDIFWLFYHDGPQEDYPFRVVKYEKNLITLQALEWSLGDGKWSDTPFRVQLEKVVAERPTPTYY